MGGKGRGGGACLLGPRNRGLFSRFYWILSALFDQCWNLLGPCFLLWGQAVACEFASFRRLVIPQAVFSSQLRRSQINMQQNDPSTLYGNHPRSCGAEPSFVVPASRSRASLSGLGYSVPLHDSGRFAFL